MTFPVAPKNGEQYTVDDTTWEYVASKGLWDLVSWTKPSAPPLIEIISGGGSTTWYKPSNASTVFVAVIGGGGGGQAGSTTEGGQGGYGGGYSSATFDASLLPSSVPVTIGVGGMPGTTLPGGLGFSGGSSSFGTALKAGGGPRGGSFPILTGGTGHYVGGAGGLSTTNGEDSYGGAGGGGGGGFNSTPAGIGGSSVPYSIPTGWYIYDLAVPGSGGSGRTGEISGPFSGNEYGGGGGAGLGGSVMTAGAYGADGVVLVVTYFA
jgi:hypothetical protein